MFRHCIAIFLLIAFAVQSFSQALIVADYYANTEAFAKNCENKVRPQLKCHGKCQMMKKLQEAEKKSSQAPERKGEVKNDLAASNMFLAGVPVGQNPVAATYACYQPAFYPSGKATDVFHPPLVF